MASSYTDLLRLEKQANGENDSTWGDKVNAVFEMIEDGIAGMAHVPTTGGTTTLSTANSSTDEARMAIVKVYGTLTSNATIIVPSSNKRYTFWNATGGNFSVTVKTSGGSGQVIPQGSKVEIFCDSVDVHKSSGDIPPGSVMLFYSATAPTGWTKNTSSLNHALRVVGGSGGGATGGLHPFTAVFDSRMITGVVGNTTLESWQIPAHSHTGTAYNGGNDGTAFAHSGVSWPSYTVTSHNTGGGGAHNHTFTGDWLEMRVQYLDFIMATKN
jgi:hypothetical protein